MRGRFWPWVTIHLHVVGNNNRVNAAGRDLHATLTEVMNGLGPDPAGAPRTGPSYRRLGGIAATALMLVAGTVVTLTQLDSPPSLPSTWPIAMTALCNDGSFSDSRTRTGTCAHHDGVAHWRYDRGHAIWRQPARRARSTAPAPPAAPATGA